MQLYETKKFKAQTKQAIISANVISLISETWSTKKFFLSNLKFKKKSFFKNF